MQYIAPIIMWAILTFICHHVANLLERWMERKEKEREYKLLMLKDTLFTLETLKEELRNPNSYYNNSYIPELDKLLKEKGINN